MKKFISNLTFNQRLAAAAILLGVLALFAGDPYNNASAKIDTKELSLIVNNKVDHVTCDELAGWIIQGKSDFRLLDLRDEKEFAAYNIPKSDNVPLALLMESGLQRNEKIVLYSEGGIHSAQAWFLLKAKGYKAVYILFGGLEEWKDQILFPKPAADTTEVQKTVFEKKKEIAKYFGGEAQTGGSAEAVQAKIGMPKLAMPGPAAAPKAGGGVKQKKEGC